ncbi:MAG: alkylated DNA repair dioxygenase AlkB [Dinoroseobacter sp.]|jgi:alkylated DNA repair dioxygenase AlkB
MSKLNYQYQLAKYQTHILDVPDADIEYSPEFIKADVAWQLYERLLDQTQWCQERISLYGKTHDVPRLSCWMADPGLSYAYSNMTMHPVNWSPDLIDIKRQIEDFLAMGSKPHLFNSVLLNQYRNGQDSNGWHSDNESELGSNPVIASLSLGGGRDFHLRHKKNKALRKSIHLEHGSLLLMRGTTQHCWQHHIPKRANADRRINLTFRTIIN